MKDLQKIKEQFLASLDDDNASPVDALRQAASDLQDLGMDIPAAAHTITHWAVEGGLFDPEVELVAEQAAKGVLEDANA